MYFVYILKSHGKKEYYKGISDNLERRLLQHFAGQVASTKLKLPLSLIHVEICATRGQARKMELFFKNGYGREIIKEIDDNLV